jgi:CRAL/TRIO domain
LWQIVEKDRPLATMTNIIDLYGLNLSVLRQGDIISFLKIFVKTMDSHFPQRANLTLVVNAPKWFHLLYKLLSPLLRETTKEKIRIHSNGKEQDNALRQQLDDDCIAALPKSFWSDTPRTTSKNDEETIPFMSQLEQDLHEFVSKNDALRKFHLTSQKKMYLLVLYS